MLWGYTGILTFGQSAFFGIGAYAAGMIFTHMGFSPRARGAGAAGRFGRVGVVACMAGWLSFFHGASPLYVAMVTLALPIIVMQVLYSGGTFTGSSSGLSGYDSFSVELEAWFTDRGIGLVVLPTAAWFFVNSDSGRVLVAIRENEPRCTYLGIDASRVKILLMVASAVVASIAGYAYRRAYRWSWRRSIAGFVFGTELVMWVALGGRGTLIGPVHRHVLIDVISAYLSGNLPFMWKLVIGVDLRAGDRSAAAGDRTSAQDWPAAPVVGCHRAEMLRGASRSRHSLSPRGTPRAARSDAPRLERRGLRLLLRQP